jgi:MFS family permease
MQNGCGYYAFSLFVRPLEAEWGWGRGEIMIAFTILYLFIGIASPFIGRAVDHYGVRKVISIGALMAGVGFVFLSQMRDLWYFYVGYAVIGVGLAAIGILPASAVVSNWFKRKRGLAIGIMSTGVGAGGFVLAPVVGGYLIPNFGWRASYLALAFLIWLLIIPLALLVIKTKPAEIGLFPDGAEAPKVVNVMTEAHLLASDGLTLKMAFPTSAFWLIGVSFLLSGFSQSGITLSQVPYLEDIGFPIVTAVSALGAVGLGSLIGKFGFGWLCDRIPAKYACCIGLVLQLAASIILISVGLASPLAIIWLYAIVMGLGIGSWMPTMSMLTSTNFGLASYGAIFGVLNLVFCISAATGPLIAGYIYDTMNTYYWAFIIFIALYAIAIPAILGVQRPKSPWKFKGALVNERIVLLDGGRR